MRWLPSRACGDPARRITLRRLPADRRAVCPLPGTGSRNCRATSRLLCAVRTLRNPATAARVLLHPAGEGETCHLRILYLISVGGLFSGLRLRDLFRLRLLGFAQTLDALPDAGDSSLGALKALHGRDASQAVKNRDQSLRRPRFGQFHQFLLAAEAVEGRCLKVICEKSKPEVIGLPTTGLTETQGTDIRGVVKAFRARHPEFDRIAVVPVNTPDFVGCLESGFALAVEAMIDVLVPGRRTVGRRRRQVNVLAGSALTPGDIEALKDWIESFGLRPVVLPDIGDSLDGHLVDQETTPLTLGGTPRGEIPTMGESIATFVVGRSLSRAADLLKNRTGVPDFRFDHLMGLDACDLFTQTLATVSGQPVPEKIERNRAQLQDAMVDSHFMAGFR